MVKIQKRFKCRSQSSFHETLIEKHPC